MLLDSAFLAGGAARNELQLSIAEKLDQALHAMYRAWIPFGFYVYTEVMTKEQVVKVRGWRGILQLLLA